MNDMRIARLRQDRGWTQERLAGESRVAVRTVQRLEAGSEGSLDTLASVAAALGVTIRELFEDQPAVVTEEQRTGQQDRRDVLDAAWRRLFVGLGVVVTLMASVLPQFGTAVAVAWWTGGLLVFLALRRLVIEPRLDRLLPLSSQRRRPRRSRPADIPSPA